MILPVVLSGGAGSRLWPLSRAAHPKQLLRLLGEHTMVQDTATRFESDGFHAPVFLCNADHAEAILAQVPNAGALLLEPVGRNTAPAAAMAALHGRDVGAELVLLAPADHHVGNVAAFRAAAKAASRAALAGHIVTFGISPDRAETGYGYIKMGEGLSDETDAVRRVDAFVEKPDAATAQTYLEAGCYAWNAGLFLFSPEVLLAELATHAPDILATMEAAFASARRDGIALHFDREIFASCRADSFDYAVMEPTDRAACLPVSMDWTDIGSFAALRDARPSDAQGNRAPDGTSLINSVDCLVETDGPNVSLIGVENLGVIVRDGEILVLNLDAAQDVKTRVDDLKSAGETDRL